MFKKIVIKVNAENPQLPLMPSEVFEGSAASFEIMGVPRDLGKRRITSVAVVVTNVAGVSTVCPAVANGCVWSVTVPAAAIGPSGSVGNGVMIEASGTDETGGDVPCWILGAGCLVVMKTDGTVAPGDPSITLRAYDARPTHPRKWDIAPNPTTGALERYDGTAWVPFGSGGGGADVTGKLPVCPLPKYLHALSFDDPYKADAEAWYKSLAPDAMGGACSAVRRGGKLYRNYDWTFDDAAEFVVRMSAADGRHASVGVSSLGAALTEDEVMSGVYTAKYRALPGMTLDGINDAGVVAEINVDGGPKTGWHGDAEDDGIHILAAVRWVLDHGENAMQAAEWLADHIIQPTGEMNFHFMVADATKTYIVENGVAHDVTNGTKVLTNYGVFDAAQAGGGKERYNLLAGGADISAVHWTNAYQQGNTWHSDFESEAQHAAAIEQWAAQGTDKEAHRGKTTTSGEPWWQTVHTSEYDFAAKTMRGAVQESGEYFTFAAGAKAEVAWGDVKDKPETFPPSSHTHTQSQVEGLGEALDAKRGKTDFKTGEFNTFSGEAAKLFENLTCTVTYASESPNPEKWICILKSNGDDISALALEEVGDEIQFSTYKGVVIAHRDFLAKTSQLPAVVAPSFAADEGQAADAKATHDALENKADEFTEWVCTPSISPYHMEWFGEETGNAGWAPSDSSGWVGIKKGGLEDTSITWSTDEWAGGFAFTSTRKRVLRTGDAPTEQEVEALIDAKTDAIIVEKLADIDPDNASIYDLIKALKGE